MKSWSHGVAIEGWNSKHKSEVRHWLGLNFGPENGSRWGTMYDYGLESLEMDEDVYMAYLLRWGNA